MKKFISTVLVILMLTGVLAITGCEAEVKEPEYTIKIYNDDWEEVQQLHYLDRFRFEYDGKPKCFNAKAFVCGQEVAYFEYANPRVSSRLNVHVSGLNGGFKVPVERDDYFITYELRTAEFVGRSKARIEVVIKII